MFYPYSDDVKVKKKIQSSMRSIKRKKFSISSKAMKVYLTKRKKTYNNNTQNWKMSSVVSFFPKKKKKKITEIISWNLK